MSLGLFAATEIRLFSFPPLQAILLRNAVRRNPDSLIQRPSRFTKLVHSAQAPES
jgi:hypothetical protein